MYKVCPVGYMSFHNTAVHIHNTLRNSTNISQTRAKICGEPTQQRPHHHRTILGRGTEIDVKA
jgi:hypothetical protein